jgi:DNA-directed RNA polymerase subunit RPC12/RpoP
MAETEARPAAAEGSAAGCASGFLMAGCILPGALLCFTGVGAIIGVPMIILGLMGPIMGPLMGTGAKAGPCPWCGTRAMTPLSAFPKPGFDCPACKKRIIVRGNKFIGI